MRFEEAPLPGVWAVAMERRGDERGWFARTYDGEEFRSRGMKLDIVQANASSNARAGTLRGMHFQRAPHAQAKLLRCTRGAVYDAIIDLRPASPTFKQWFQVELTEANRRIPEDLKVYSSFGDQARQARQESVRRPTVAGSRERSRGPQVADEPRRGLFKAALDKTSPRNADSVPLPLLILGGMALLLISAGAAGLVARRVRARRTPAG